MLTSQKFERSFPETVMPSPLLFKLYGFFTRYFYFMTPAILKWRLRRQKEIFSRKNERLGQPTIPRPEGELIWFHGASVGETLSLLSLLPALEQPNRHILLTYNTVNAMLALQNRLPPAILQQFVPFDFPTPVERFISHWKPDMAIFIESEIWPHFICALKERGAFIGIINGRLSTRSFYIWRALHSTIHWLTKKIDFCLCQTEEDAARYRKLGLSGATSAGNLKFDNPALPVNAAALTQLRESTKEKRILLAVSVHNGEESELAEAIAICRAQFQDFIAIIIPRHPERAAKMRTYFENRNLRVSLRSESATPLPETDVYLANTIGETGLFYRLAPIAFIGGSFTKVGGHNPIEPAQLEVVTLHGPHVFNFSQIYGNLHAARAARKVRDGKELADAFLDLTRNDAKRKELQENSAAFIAKSTGAAARTLAEIKSWSQRRPRR